MKGAQKKIFHLPHREVLSFALLFATLAFGGFWIEQSPQPIGLLGLMGAVFFGFFFGDAKREPQRSLPREGMLLAALLLAALALYSQFGVGVWRVFVIGGLSFYAGKCLALGRKEALMQASGIMTALAALVAAYGILEVLFARNFLYEHLIANPYYRRYVTGLVRPMATQLNPTPLGTYLVFVLPYAGVLVARKTKVWRILAVAAFVLIAVCAFLTLSRSALAGMVIMSLGYLTFRQRYRDLAVLLALCFALGIILSRLPYPFSRFGLKGFWIEDGILGSFRMTRVHMAVAMWKTHPLLGVGFDQFRQQFELFYPLRQQIPFVPMEKRVADNMYLTLLAEWGIIGLSAFLFFSGSLLLRCWQRLTKGGNLSEENPFFLAAILSFFSLLTGMFGYELLYWNVPLSLFALNAGFLKSLLTQR